MTTHSKWSVRFTPMGQKNFEKLDKPIQNRIQKFLKERVLSLPDPRQLGKTFTGNLSNLWSYRLGNYRIIAKIEDVEVLILIVRVAHRSEVYD